MRHRLFFGLAAGLFALFQASALLATPFKVGVSLPLVGPYSDYGTAVQNGINLALRDRPELFGNIRFLFDDDSYDPKRTIAVLNKFVDLDRINLFFVWGNEPALGVAPVAERRQTPTLVVAQHPKAGAGLQYVIRFINPASDYGHATAEYLKQRGFNRIVMLKTEISFFNVLIEELENSLLDGQEIVWIESFLSSEFDFKPTIAKLKLKSFDVLGVYLHVPQVIQYYRQAAQLNYRSATFGTTPFESKTVIEQALGAMEGAFYAHLNVEEDFRNRYIKEFGDDIEVTYAANSYQFAILVGQLFGQLSSSPSPEEIINAFSNVPPGHGPCGKFRLRKDSSSGKYFEFPLAIRIIRHGKIIFAHN